MRCIKPLGAACMSVALEAEDLTRIFGGGRTLFGGRRPAIHAVAGRRPQGGDGRDPRHCRRVRLRQDDARPDAGRARPADRRHASGCRAATSTALAGRDPRALAQHIQYVFQDPVASLNPRKTIRQILEAPMIRLHRLSTNGRGRRSSASCSARSASRRNSSTAIRMNSPAARRSASASRGRWRPRLG